MGIEPLFDSGSDSPLLGCDEARCRKPAVMWLGLSALCWPHARRRFMRRDVTWRKVTGVTDEPLLHRSRLHARLDCVPVPTVTRVWWADSALECAICERPIMAGDLFTRALATGHGRRHVPQCRTCRPFMVQAESDSTGVSRDT
jgi:hypothetical protein